MEQNWTESGEEDVIFLREEKKNPLVVLSSKPFWMAPVPDFTLPGTWKRARGVAESNDENPSELKKLPVCEASVKLTSMYRPKHGMTEFSAAIVWKLPLEEDGYVIQQKPRGEYFIISRTMMELEKGTEIHPFQRKKPFTGVRKIGDKVAMKMADHIVGVNGESLAGTLMTGKIIHLLPPKSYVVQCDPPDFDPTCEYNWWTGYDIREESEFVSEEFQGKYKVGDMVCVDMDTIPKYAYNFAFCHMDGKVENIASDGKLSVCLNGLNTYVNVTLNQVEPQRFAEPNKKWKTGDDVQVLEVNDGVLGWWDANIVEESIPSVQWKTEYEKHANWSFVERKNIRSGKPKLWELVGSRRSTLSRNKLTCASCSVTEWHCAAKGSVGWSEGVHSWIVRIDDPIKGVSIGVSRGDVSLDNAHDNIFKRYDMYSRTGEGIDIENGARPCLKGPLKKNSLVSVCLDLNKKTITFGLNGIMNTDPTFTDIGDGEWFPYFAFRACGSRITIVKQY